MWNWWLDTFPSAGSEMQLPKVIAEESQHPPILCLQNVSSLVEPVPLH